MDQEDERAARKTTIFLADDDEDMRTLVAVALRNDGHEVVEARDGAELMELLSSAFGRPDASPDLVLMDVVMPMCSGLGVLTAIRRVRWDLPIIVMTAFPHASVLDYALYLGAAAVFRKPFDIDDLRTAVVNVYMAHLQARGRAEKLAEDRRGNEPTDPTSGTHPVPRFHRPGESEPPTSSTAPWTRTGPRTRG
jgi:DNA-binding NtrC family response regulator